MSKKKIISFLLALVMMSGFCGYAGDAPFAGSGSGASASSPPFSGTASTAPLQVAPTEAQILAGIRSGKYICQSLVTGKAIKAEPQPKSKWKPVIEPYMIMPRGTNQAIASIDDYSNNIAVITEAQLKAIAKDMTYYDIATMLGKTRDSSLNKTYEYHLKDGRILFLPVKDKTAKCKLSGNSLLKSAVLPRNQLNSQSKGNYFAIIIETPMKNTQGNTSFLSYSTGKGSLGAAVISTTKSTSFFYENGKAAKASDLKFGVPVLLTLQGGILESYPVQAKAKKIVILDPK